MYVLYVMEYSILKMHVKYLIPCLVHYRYSINGGLGMVVIVTVTLYYYHYYYYFKESDINS